MTSPSTSPSPDRLYFGYGSNMDVAQMAQRCPDAVLLGVARLDGWTFHMDSNGYATIDRDGGSVEGTLWRVTPVDEASLDGYEGLDRGLYHKEDVRVELDGRSLDAFVYVSDKLPLTMETFRAEYIQKIAAAAEALGLSEAARARIAEVRVTEKEPTRA